MSLRARFSCITCFAGLLLACSSGEESRSGASSGGAGGAGAEGGSAGSGGSTGGTSGGGTGGDATGGAGGSSSGAGGAGTGGSGTGGAGTGGSGTGGSGTGGAGTGGSGTGGTGGVMSCAHDGEIADVVVSNGSSLQAAVDAATSGAVIWIQPGDYSCLQIEQRAFSASAPLILRKDPTTTGDVRIVPGSCWFAVRIVESSWVVLDGLVVDGGGISVYVDHSDHVILTELEVLNSGQEGIQVRNDSTNVDVLRSHVHHTGVTEPKWGECVYVGTGSDQDFPDHTEYVWIEGNDFHHCGLAEGVNVKPEVFHTTVRGNEIHDITPGTADQYNESALTVEGETRDYLRGTPREIWVENNEIHHVSLGRWGNCAMVGGTGVFFVNNTVHDCDERGIYGNGFGDLGHPLVLFGNTVTNTGGDAVWVASSIDLVESDPGANPHRPQDWYCR